MTEKIECMKKGGLTRPKEPQTESTQELRCSKCNFIASNYLELNWHLGNIHGLSINQSSDD